MGKRSQAKGMWLTGSQREARGEAKSGARLWFLKPGAPKPKTLGPIPKRRPEDAKAVQGQAAIVSVVQTAQDGPCGAMVAEDSRTADA
jgi:hypothetical protein